MIFVDIYGADRDEARESTRELLKKELDILIQELFDESKSVLHIAEMARDNFFEAGIILMKIDEINEGVAE